MNGLDKSKELLKLEMQEFSNFFSKSVKSNTALLNIITSYILKKKGKQIRPLLVFLSAKMFGNIGNSTYIAAALIELLHSATLIHDDVVDESDKRRSFFSINALWGNKIAVLVGDYLLSKGLLLAVDNNKFETLKIVSEAVKEMSEGELLQIKKTRTLDIDEKTYFEIIRKKTATLFVAACKSGAESVNAKEQDINKIEEFGEIFGLIFQLKDDVFDYQNNTNTGKPSKNDIREQKITLPLIYSLQNASNEEKRNIIKIVKNKNTRKYQEIINFVKEKKGIEYSTNKIEELTEKAVKTLETFEKNEAQETFIELVRFTANRNS